MFAFDIYNSETHFERENTETQIAEFHKLCNFVVFFASQSFIEFANLEFLASI